MANKLRINPPLYLLTTDWPCWQCETKIPLVALLAANTNENSHDICILSNILKLPNEILAFIQSRVPSFKYAYSKAIESYYYANTCPSCGVVQGDFFLHTEPGSPFRPLDKQEASALCMITVPLEKTIVIKAECGTGASNDLIYAHAKRIA